MNFKNHYDKIKKHREQGCRHKEEHQEEECMHKKELRKQHADFQKESRELRKRFKDLYKHIHEFQRFHKHFRYFRYVFIAVNLLIWYLIFRYAGFRGISVFFAVLLSAAGIFQVFFNTRIERRILNPIDKLKKGVEQIASGNYDVNVECMITNEVGNLVDAFNDMAHKLKEGERLKSEYEENRKALIANISHDIKTPVTSVQGYVEALLEREDPGSGDVKKYLQIIHSNTLYINKLIDDLFLFSKLDMDKLDFNFETIGIRAYMSDLMEEFGLELEEKEVAFAYNDTTDRDFLANIDRKRINQALRNIIGNSVKYGPEKGLSILACMSGNEDHIQIDIEDNGPGIPREHLDHIFDRFYRVDNERTKDLLSSGLGLAIAKELIQAHGGEISAANLEDGVTGIRFTIKLPVIKNDPGKDFGKAGDNI